jgi:hypothetical protein
MNVATIGPPLRSARLFFRPAPAFIAKPMGNILPEICILSNNFPARPGEPTLCLIACAPGEWSDFTPAYAAMYMIGCLHGYLEVNCVEKSFFHTSTFAPAKSRS